MAESFQPDNQLPEIDRFAAMLDGLIVSPQAGNHVPMADMDSLDFFAQHLQHVASPRLSPVRKRDMWIQILADTPATPFADGFFPPKSTIPTAVQPQRRRRFPTSGSRTGIVPPIMTRPASGIMLTIALLLAAIAGLAGFGQSGSPGATTPTAFAHDQIVVASPDVCLHQLATPETATPSSNATSTSGTATPAADSCVTSTASSTPIPRE